MSEVSFSSLESLLILIQRFLFQATELGQVFHSESNTPTTRNQYAPIHTKYLSVFPRLSLDKSLNDYCYIIPIYTYWKLRKHLVENVQYTQVPQVVSTERILIGWIDKDGHRWSWCRTSNSLGTLVKAWGAWVASGAVCISICVDIGFCSEWSADLFYNSPWPRDTGYSRMP